REYPGRVVATDLVNPDFAALAAAFGWHGEVVATTGAFGPALDRARGAGRPALIEVRADPDQLSLDTTLADLRSAAGGARG
ncbi:thiamine pyrophosphate-dependent enzyme, partial [Streptomyces niveiscabiei]|uniref:thiamine pyrophosphate-dependent enzyme n=1 Tax=Streptomyces niveiscabiei TaxID=164115 RepID=UPI0038F6B4EC